MPMCAGQHWTPQPVYGAPAAGPTPQNGRQTAARVQTRLAPSSSSTATVTVTGVPPTARDVPMGVGPAGRVELLTDGIKVLLWRARGSPGAWRGKQATTVGGGGRTNNGRGMRAGRRAQQWRSTATERATKRERDRRRVSRLAQPGRLQHGREKGGRWAGRPASWPVPGRPAAPAPTTRLPPPPTVETAPVRTPPPSPLFHRRRVPARCTLARQAGC